MRAGRLVVAFGGDGMRLPPEFSTSIPAWTGSNESLTSEPCKV